MGELVLGFVFLVGFDGVVMMITLRPLCICFYNVSFYRKMFMINKL